MKHKNIGSDFSDFLREEGIAAEAEALALKEILAEQIFTLMTEKKLSKTTMARRMATSRSALDRLLDPKNLSLSLKTLDKAAASLGKRLIIELV